MGKREINQLKSMLYILHLPLNPRCHFFFLHDQEASPCELHQWNGAFAISFLCWHWQEIDYKVEDSEVLLHLASPGFGYIPLPKVTITVIKFSL